MAKLNQHASTPPQLQDDIQHGRTSDKVRGPDPAMAPLGTDEEAAGTPTGPLELSQARAAEKHPSVTTDPERSNKYATWSGVLIWIAAVTFLVVVVGAALIFVEP